MALVINDGSNPRVGYIKETGQVLRNIININLRTQPLDVSRSLYGLQYEAGTTRAVVECYNGPRREFYHFDQVWFIKKTEGRLI